ncbi:ribonuclease III domain-containing protein [Russula brevipes]|nr:ribonuclease III domain-containing protein [Russula brevipes]
MSSTGSPLLRIFTHSSLTHKYGFQGPAGDPIPDSEELAHIGDQVFGLAVTDLIQALYPYLLVGPASKVRDHVKCKLTLAEICVSYGLHERLHLPERQSTSLKASRNVRANVFKAYVGGVYREQGMEIVSKWLNQLLRAHVEAAYCSVRKDYLLPPVTTTIPQPQEPTTRYPSPTSSSTSHDTGPAQPSRPAGDAGDPRPTIPPQANVSQQGSRQAGGGADGRPEMADQPRRKRPRRRSGPRDGGSGDAVGADHLWIGTKYASGAGAGREFLGRTLQPLEYNGMTAMGLVYCMSWGSGASPRYCRQSIWGIVPVAPRIAVTGFS